MRLGGAGDSGRRLTLGELVERPSDAPGRLSARSDREHRLKEERRHVRPPFRERRDVLVDPRRNRFRPRCLVSGHLEEERTMTRDRPDVVHLPVRVRFLAVVTEVTSESPDRRRARRPEGRPALGLAADEPLDRPRASTGRASSPRANDSRRSTTSLSAG